LQAVVPVSVPCLLQAVVPVSVPCLLQVSVLVLVEALAYCVRLRERFCRQCSHAVGPYLGLGLAGLSFGSPDSESECADRSCVSSSRDLDADCVELLLHHHTMHLLLQYSCIRPAPSPLTWLHVPVPRSPGEGPGLGLRLGHFLQRRACRTLEMDPAAVVKEFAAATMARAYFPCLVAQVHVQAPLAELGGAVLLLHSANEGHGVLRLPPSRDRLTSEAAVGRGTKSAY